VTRWSHADSAVEKAWGDSGHQRGRAPPATERQAAASSRPNAFRRGDRGTIRRLRLAERRVHRTRPALRL